MLLVVQRYRYLIRRYGLGSFTGIRQSFEIGRMMVRTGVIGFSLRSRQLDEQGVDCNGK